MASASCQPSQIRRAAQKGGIIAHFQPIERLDTGLCLGLEALARLDLDGALLSPAAFLPHLGPDGRLSLFGSMLEQAGALLSSAALAGTRLRVSVNVDISIVTDAGCIDVLRDTLERYGVCGERLVLEILETEDIVDLAHLQARLAQIKALGLSLALDDVGSGYASLRRLRELPIDIFKLDRSIIEDLERRPEDLAYVTSMLALARGTGKTMVVEGIETDEVYDALRVLGVEAGQGWAIARPMPADAVAAWLATRKMRTVDRRPTSLLGAYACHRAIVELCRSLRTQPFPVDWRPATRDPFNIDQSDIEQSDCPIRALFAARGWHDTKFARAHRDFRAALAGGKDLARFDAAADRVFDTMAEAIVADKEA